MADKVREKNIFHKESEDLYRSADGRSMGRENGLDPKGNPIGGRWVLRSESGEFVDFDQYRHDLASRNGLDLENHNGFERR